MSALNIRLFGGLHLTHRDNTPITLQPSVQIFLAFLLLNRHRYHCREVLSSIFWGERGEKRARRCLNTTLWRLRRELDPIESTCGAFIVTTYSGEIGFNNENENYWLDVDVFEEKVRHSLNCHPETMDSLAIQSLEEAVELYCGDLLEGVYTDWALRHRENMRLQYLKCLMQLMYYYGAQQEYQKSIQYGRRVLEMDPLREDVHRDIMRLYLQNGNRSQAIQQYDTCRQILAQELDIQPMPETTSVYQHCLSLDSPTVNIATSKNIEHQPEDLQEALRQLNQALLGFEEMRGQVQQAIQTINGVINK